MDIPSRCIVHLDLFRCGQCNAASHYVRSEVIVHKEPLPAPSGQIAVDPETGDPILIAYTTYTLRCSRCSSDNLEKVSSAKLPFQSHLLAFEEALYKIKNEVPT